MTNKEFLYDDLPHWISADIFHVLRRHLSCHLTYWKIDLGNILRCFVKGRPFIIKTKGSRFDIFVAFSRVLKFPKIVVGVRLYWKVSCYWLFPIWIMTNKMFGKIGKWYIPGVPFWRGIFSFLPESTSEKLFFTFSELPLVLF